MRSTTCWPAALQFMFATIPSVIEHIQAGKLRASR